MLMLMMMMMMMPVVRFAERALKGKGAFADVDNNLGRPTDRQWLDWVDDRLVG